MISIRTYKLLITSSDDGIGGRDKGSTVPERSRTPALHDHVDECKTGNETNYERCRTSKWYQQDESSDHSKNDVFELFFNDRDLKVVTN